MVFFSKYFVSQYVDFVINRPYLNILLSLLFFSLFAPGNIFFQERYDVRVWFQESDPHIQTLDVFERHFGNDESLVISFRNPDGIFNSRTIELIHELTDKLWEVPQVIRVESLTNYNDSFADQERLYIQAFIDPDDVLDEVFLAAKKERALAHPVLPDYLISRDAKSVMIFARLVTTLDGSPDYQVIVEHAKNLIANYREKYPEIEFHLIGEAAVNDAFRSVPESDGMVIMPILILVIFLYLFLTFKHFLVSFFPLIMTGMALLMTFGLGFYFNIAYNSVLTILPAIIVAICVADSIHVIISYFQFKSLDDNTYRAAKLSLEKNFTPTFLTSISTMIGFSSLTLTELLPIRELGLLAGFSCLVAWILTIHFIGPLLLISNFKVPLYFKKAMSHEMGHPFAVRLMKWIERYAAKIVVFVSLLTLSSLYFAINNKVNSNPYDYFRDGIAVREANKFIQYNFGSNAGPEIMIKTHQVDGIKNPEFLQKINQFKAWLEDQDYIVKTIDILDVIKQLNQDLNGGNPNYYKIPANQNEIAEILFLYSMSLPQGMEINNRVSVNDDSLRMSVLWSVFDTQGWLYHTQILEDKMQQLGIEGYVTGKFLLFQRMMGYVVKTFIGSVTLALILVGILLALIFRSVKLGLLSLAPNLIPLSIGGGFMYFSGIDLNIGSAIVASVTLGIAVDDTIHFLTNLYRDKFQKGYSTVEAGARVISFTGPALLMTTLILVTSFGLYLLGDFVPNIHFGILCALVLSSALIIDLIFLPAVLILSDRYRARKMS